MIAGKETQLLSLIEGVYDAALDGSKWPIFLGRFANACRGAACLFSQHMQAGDTSVAVQVGMDPAAVASYVHHYSALKPWLSTLRRQGAGLVVTERELIDKRTFERSEYYNDWLRPQGFYHLFGGVVCKDGPVNTTITALRPAAAGGFDETEQDICRHLIPHLRRAIQVHQQLHTAKAANIASAHALDSLKVGIVLVDGFHRVLFANASADRILSLGDTLTVKHGKLSTARSLHAGPLAALIRSAVDVAAGTGHDAGRLLRLERPCGGELAVLVCPLRAADALIGHCAPAAMVFISNPGTSPKVPETVLARYYGLTRAETRLLSALVGGITIADYAESAGIQRETVRKHLKQLFSKTGQNRQADLIRHVLTNPLLSAAGRLD